MCLRNPAIVRGEMCCGAEPSSGDAPPPRSPYTPLGAFRELVVGRYVCAGGPGRSTEQIGAPELIFVHRGVFFIETTRGSVVADPGQLLLLRQNEEYRVRHPLQCGDECLVLTIAPAALEGSAGDGPDIDPEHDFGALSRAAEPEVFRRSRALRAALESGTSDPEQLREEAAELLIRAIRGTAEPASGRTPRERRLGRERVEQVQIRLASDLTRAWTLDELAAEVGGSPFHLARLFRDRTGRSIRQHLITLRLRAALDRLAAGERDLAGLAHELGFADHAHFTHAFRRQFGQTPSRARQELRRRARAGT